MVNETMKCVIKSYLQGVLTEVTPLLAIHSTDAWAYAMAVVAGVIAPAIRAIDPKDQAFGIVADALVTEVDKMAHPTAKKAVKKTAKKK